MDVMFALLVLALFMHARTLVALRVLTLIVLSVLVHFLSIEFLVATRGSLDVSGIDTIWLNVIPIAAVFLLTDLELNMGWLTWSANWYWAVWHVSLCVALYNGRSATSRIHP